jgi:WD40 repeat protein
MAVGTFKRGVRLWEVATGKELAGIPRGFPRRVHAVVFSPDGKTLATASCEREIKLWDVTKVLEKRPGK